MYNCSKTKGLPGLPPLPGPYNSEASDLYKIVLKHSEHPPIMADSSWTRAVPFKEVAHHRTPSESIANNYTLSASGLKIRNLSKIKSPRPKTQEDNCTSPRKTPRRHLRSRSDESSSRRLAPSRPLTPRQQIDIINCNSVDENNNEMEPSDRDLQRYHHYIINGVPQLAILEQDPESLNKVVNERIHQKLREAPIQLTIIEQLKEEVQRDFTFSLKKSIVDYILKDEKEKQRLHISAIPKIFKNNCIRAPVPWHQIYKATKEQIGATLFTINPVMIELQNIWHQKFSKCRFVDINGIFESATPMYPHEFEEVVKKQCAKAKDDLIKIWVPTCANVLKTLKNHWIHLLPTKENESVKVVQSFFACVATIMAVHLRSMVLESLHDFLDFLKRYENGNDFEEPFNELIFVKPQVITMNVIIRDRQITFEPQFTDLRDVVMKCFTEIVGSAENIPRVEGELFPDLKKKDLYLRCVNVEEGIVTEFIEKGISVFKENTTGPQKYIKIYKKYQDFLTGKADTETANFLQEPHGLSSFSKKIQQFKSIANEIASLHITVPLNLLCLNCVQVNEELEKRARNLENRFISFVVDLNRDQNRGICKKFDEISDRCKEISDKTSELVELEEYVKNASTVRVLQLQNDVDGAAERLLFLLDYANLPYEDIKLNNTVFYWPEQIKKVFELSQNRIDHRKEIAVDELKIKLKEFEEKLKVYEKEAESFKKKEIMNTEEMTKNVEKLNELDLVLNDAKERLEALNEEEELLEFEPSQFPELQDTIAFKEPYDKLWKTALGFATKHEQWMNGPFSEIDAEALEEEVSNMWRTMFKLSKTFDRVAGPKRVADSTKSKIDKFKVYLPLLSCICNPGLRERHWEQMSEIVEYDIKPEPTTSLSHMIEFGLQKHLEKLDEISGAATKEYSLEKAMEKMKSEWSGMHFELIPYRDTV